MVNSALIVSKINSTAIERMLIAIKRQEFPRSSFELIIVGMENYQSNGTIPGIGWFLQ